VSIVANYLVTSDDDVRWLMDSPDAVFGYVYEQRAGEAIDVDKAWHGIHFLLNGHAHTGNGPLADTVFGGTVIGSSDLGYGPARALYSSTVREIAAALKPIGECEFRSRFDSQQLVSNRIYPSIWADEIDALDYLVHYYTVVKRVYRRAAKATLGIIIYFR
jgi:hypothetical protein